VAARLSARALSGLPGVQAGDDLGALIVAAIAAERPSGSLGDGQIVAVAHKIVSKAEGAIVALADVQPSARAHELARAHGKDPRAVQVVLDQSAELLRAERGVLICRTHHGFVCANAGVDTSNVTTALSPSTPGAEAADAQVGDARAEGEDDMSRADAVVVLPRDPDASARRLRSRLRELTGAAPAILITDSFGRAWRQGQCDIAIGCAGMLPLEDWRGRTDAAGVRLRATWLAVADAIAATADLARAKDSREPVVIVEGLERLVTDSDGPGAAVLRRPVEEDLFG
jgi:coenzyme F420-0:L-glutamate ligase / coenzyme F420-1:gamma-L-glutamate ligase